MSTHTAKTDTWQLKAPINAVVFDCDGTLSTIEGIDELARQHAVGDIVQSLTDKAMNVTGVNPDLYKKRLELVAPTKDDLVSLGDIYFDHAVTDAKAVISTLASLGKTIYIVSAGLNPAVTCFGNKLSVPDENIFAVDTHFNADGSYAGYDEKNPLTSHLGKIEIVKKLKEKHGSIAHIGDGINDLVTIDLVDRFIGFGGVFHRDSIKEKCQYYVTDTTLACTLPLLLTLSEANALNPAQKELYNKCLLTQETRQHTLDYKKYVIKAD